MGNLYQEHKFRTDGDGLCQWLGERRNKLQSLPNWQDLNVQLDYMMSELNGSEIYANNLVKQSTTIEDATIAFQNGFERCGNCMENQRIQYAIDIYGRY